MSRRALKAFDFKAERLKLGLSQAAAAKIICATQPSVARWESEGNMPEVFRKVWEQHWLLNSNVYSRKLDSAKCKEKTDDRRTDKSVGRVKRRGFHSKHFAGQSEEGSKSVPDINRQSAEIVPADSEASDLSE